MTVEKITMEQTFNQEMEDVIAVVGLAGKFPKAANVDEFWQNLRAGRDCITFFDDQTVLDAGLNPSFLENPAFVKAYGVLDDIDKFDASFFNIPPRDAKLFDPQHRLFLECAWQAMEQAGYDAEKYAGRIGVFAGSSWSTYLLRNLMPNDMFQFVTADRLEMTISNQKDLLPMRVSFCLNLTGPSINVNTTCSTSLVAVSLACQSLLTYQSDMVLAGGAFVRAPQTEGYLYQEGMIYSHDGHIHTFDETATGIVVGSGVGIVLLKRYEDAVQDGDTIYALIRSTALNNDGSTKAGYTAPSVDGQAEAMVEAITLAGITSDTISYVEAHGTGTALGDPVEMASLTKAFRATAANPDHQPNQFCPVGSVKTNVGHTSHAAGVTGLIKVVLALVNKQIPPSLHFNRANPKLNIENSPFYVNTELKDWQTNGVPRRALINSFGLGGTNANAIVEEAPEREPSGPTRAYQLMTLSAKTQSALDKRTSDLTAYLKQHPDTKLADVAFTLNIGRRDFNFRRTFVARDVTEAIELLESQNPKQVFAGYQKLANREVVFMFSGQGSQYVDMAQDLYDQEPLFRETVDECAALLRPHLEADIRDLLYPQWTDETADKALEQTAVTQPALFVIEYALAKLWQAWGVQPQAMVGHSIGEYVAACLAGVFSLEDALKLVAKRGQLMQSLPAGSMLAVSLSPAEVTPLLPAGLTVAVVNHPAMCVLAGETETIEAFQQTLADKQIEASMLHTSHAFHSAMMQPILEPFSDFIRQNITLNPPQMAYLSNVTGTWITAEQATDPTYWANHLRQTVQFADNVAELVKDPSLVLLEVGPGRTLSTLAKQHPAKQLEQTVLTSLRHPKDEANDLHFALSSLGKLWLAGVTMDWPAFYAHEKRHRLPLPTYPFERQRYWIDPPKETVSGITPGISMEELNAMDNEATQIEPELLNRPNLPPYVAPRTPTEKRLAAIWQNMLGIDIIGMNDDFHDLGGSSFLASQLVVRLCQALMIDLSVQEFLSNPTIAELAVVVDRLTQSVEPAETAPATGSESASVSPAEATPATGSGSVQSLIKIKAGDDSLSPIFLVHPIDGYVMFYRELADQLTSQRPVYAFQAPGLQGEATPATSVETLAQQYLAAMQTVQPQGPYYLGGASFGGVVAFEMAQQLRQQGQAVAQLFMMDTPGINEALFELNDENRILTFIANHILRLEAPNGKWQNGHPGSADFQSADPQDAGDPLSLDEKINELLAQQNGSTPTAAIEAAQIRHLMAVIKANDQALHSYVPQPYPGRLTFFRAKEPLVPTYHPERFWLDLATEGIEIYTVPGDHFSMNYQPQVKTIADKLI